MPGLEIRLLSGERFKIGKRFVLLRQIRSATTVVLELEGAMIQQFEVTNRAPVEIMPGVRVSTLPVDLAKNRNKAILVIDAPKDVRIERLQHSDDRFADGAPSHI